MSRNRLDRSIARIGWVLAIVLAASVVPATFVTGATTAPTFARADYGLFGNNYAIGDFNGDARPDLSGAGGATADVRLNNGAGAFGAIAEYAVGGPGQDIASGDFNGDRQLDLVLSLNDPEIGISLLAGNGDGTFRAPVTFPNPSRAGSPAVASVDLNNDAKLDIVIAHDIACFTAPCVNSDVISVMLGNGDGTFQPPREMTVGRGMSEIAVGDYNRDGFKDLAIGGTQGQIYRLDGLGDGTFIQRPTLIAVVDTFFIPVTDIDVADFNGDSIHDLVAAVPHNGSRTAVLIGNGDGTFRTPLVLTDSGLHIPQHQAVADYNLDGFQDLALSLGEGDQGLMQIRNGNGDGTFQAPRQYLVPPPTSSVGGIFIASANLNADTKPDIVLNIGGASPSFAVLINSTGAAAPQTPTAPTLLSPAQDARPAQPVSFDWTDVAAASSYRIQIDDSNNFSAPLVVDRVIMPSQFTSSTLNAGRQQWWRVRGVNSAGTAGPWSTVRRFTPGAFAPSATAVAPTPPPATAPPPTAPPATATPTATPQPPTPTLTVTATGRSGERVTSIPTGINVTVGSTGSGSFAIGTSITLRATNERDVIWSGACSSGGNKVKTCTFTLNGSATVTANVQ